MPPFRPSQYLTVGPGTVATEAVATHDGYSSATGATLDGAVQARALRSANIVDHALIQRCTLLV
jgi:hypothetical protein